MPSRKLVWAHYRSYKDHLFCFSGDAARGLGSVVSECGAAYGEVCMMGRRKEPTKRPKCKYCLKIEAA